MEDSNNKIETNLNQNQPVFFRRYYEDSKLNLSICSDENPIWVEFPEIYLEHNASISVIGPDGDDKHDMLKLVPLPSHDYPIHNKEILFKITKERLNLKLDFFGIQFLYDEEVEAEDIENDKKEQKRNSARLYIEIYDNDGKMKQFYKSPIIQKKDLDPLAQKSVVGNKGFCLVINHAKLQCYQDIHDIRKLFSGKLHYIFQRFRFTTTQNLTDTISQKLEMFKDCYGQIVVFVFCHVNHDIIQTNDGSIKFEEFIKLFLPENCAQISKKPKLFYLIQKEVQIDNSENIPEHSNSEKANEKIRENIPEHSNVYLASLTVPNDGTLYVRTLLKVIGETPISEFEDLYTKTVAKMKDYQNMKARNCLVQKVRFHTEN